MIKEKKLIPKRRFEGFTDEWKEYELGQIAESFEYGLNASAMKFDGENKYIRITDIDEDTRLFNQKDLTSPKTELSKAYNYLLQKGDILFARTGASVGKTFRYQSLDGKVYYAGFLIRARVKKEFDSEFVFQSTLTQRYKSYIKITSQRSGQPGVNALEYANYKLKLPNIKEQQKIGQFFKHLDDMIALEQRKIDKTKALKSAYLAEMFPAEGEHVPKRRFEGFTDEWEAKILGNIGQTYTGLLGKTKGDFGRGNAEFVTYLNVFNNPISNTNITENVEIDTKQDEVKYGDVLFTTSSETPHEVGMSSVWLFNRPNVYLNSFCFGYRISINIDYLFIAYLFRSNMIRKQMKILAQGISRYNISKNKVMEIIVLLPSKREQKKIGEFFKNLDDIIETHEQKLEKLKATKQAYLHEMFV